MTRPPPLIPTFQEWKTAGPGADKESPKSTQKEDIKVVARRVLMEARKKAGASDLLPRERVEGIVLEDYLTVFLTLSTWARCTKSG